jgi:hypothetical protein
MQDHPSNFEQAPAPELVWAKRFSRAERLFLALYFCGIPILISGLLIYLDVSPLGCVVLASSVLGVAWVSHRFGRRRYAITSETISVDLAPLGRWKVEKLEVMLRDVLFVSVKPRRKKIYSKVIVYHRSAGPPLVFDFLSGYEARAASKMLAYYGEIKKAEPISEAEPMPEAEPQPETSLEHYEVSPENPEANPENETNQEAV